MAIPNNAQGNTIIFVIPIAATIFALLAPVLTLAFLTQGGMQGGLKQVKLLAWDQPKRLSQLSIICVALSPFLLLSNYDSNNLMLYGAYGVLLGQVNLLVDHHGKKGWPALTCLHVVNALNLLGGNFSIFLQFINLGSSGIIKAAALGPNSEMDCPEYTNVPWCSNFWVTIQVLVSFVYLILHLCMLIYVSSRTIVAYGSASGSDEPLV